jgi:class 3 adenylate cyclase
LRQRLVERKSRAATASLPARRRAQRAARVIHSNMAEARKIVTVAFADVSGSTARRERLDPEALRRVMDRYFA